MLTLKTPACAQGLGSGLIYVGALNPELMFLRFRDVIYDLGMSFTI